MECNGKKTVTELIELSRGGDEAAFEELLSDYSPLIDSVIRRYSLDERDAFSEACIGFYRAVVSYELGQSDVTFGLYAKICIERCLIDMARHEGKRLSHFIDSDVDLDKIAVTDGVQAMLEHREQNAYFLSVAKDVLSDFEFDVSRQWMLGYKTSDTASELGVSAKSIDNAKNRMWAKLRKRLSSEN